MTRAKVTPVKSILGREPSEREAEVALAVHNLLDLAVESHRNEPSDETFTECLMCGDWEGHNAACPVPRLLRWLDTPWK